eukprot:GABV01000657.1.p2 GENE.GABV01000657.1~~GABV01000657.1.p2  ORF type:complete len:242 (-),score=121.73 GABV01000657.1:22-747(-)
MGIKSLRAVFGESYPDPVRVISIGKSVDELVEDPQNDAWMDFSVELCGGTHLRKLGEASAFTIVRDDTVQAGIRRFVALTGESAQDALTRVKEFESRLASVLQLPVGPHQLKELKTLQRDLQAAGHMTLHRRRALEDELGNSIRAAIKAGKKAAKKNKGGKAGKPAAAASTQVQIDPAAIKAQVQKLLEEHKDEKPILVVQVHDNAAPSELKALCTEFGVQANEKPVFLVSAAPEDKKNRI